MLRGTEASAPASSSSKGFLEIVDGRVNPVRISRTASPACIHHHACASCIKRRHDLENAITRGFGVNPWRM
jgi:hypothetical protein